MHIDFSALEVFFRYMNGKGSVEAVINHPGYQNIVRHSDIFGGQSLTVADIEGAMQGESTTFFGLKNLHRNLSQITSFIQVMKKQHKRWVEDARGVFQRLMPEEDLGQIVIYPIIGYDPGIGMNDTVSMNINWPAYFENPEEFMFLMIHETFHALYERSHTITPVNDLTTTEDWLRFFKMLFQNEGYAVYAPLKLREERGELDDSKGMGDYIVLADDKQIQEHITFMHETLDHIRTNPQIELDYIIERLFGSMRINYRVGCEIIRRIEKEAGFEAVQKAIYFDELTYFDQYSPLVLK